MFLFSGQAIKLFFMVHRTIVFRLALEFISVDRLFAFVLLMHIFVKVIRAAWPPSSRYYCGACRLCKPRRARRHIP